MAPLKDALKALPVDRMILGGLMGAAVASGKIPKGIGSKFLVEFMRPLAANEKAIDLIAAAMARAEEKVPEGFAWDTLSSTERDIWRKRAKTAIRAFSALAAHAAAGAAKAKKEK
jgi:hypothetical protein